MGSLSGVKQPELREIDVTAFRRRLSVKSGESLEGGYQDHPARDRKQRTSDSLVQLAARTLPEDLGTAISSAEEMTVLVKTLIETEAGRITEGSTGARSKIAKLGSILGQVKSRFTALRRRSIGPDDILPREKTKGNRL